MPYDSTPRTTIGRLPSQRSERGSVAPARATGKTTKNPMAAYKPSLTIEVAGSLVPTSKPIPRGSDTTQKQTAAPIQQTSGWRRGQSSRRRGSSRRRRDHSSTSARAIPGTNMWKLAGSQWMRGSIVPSVTSLASTVCTQ